MVQVFRQMAITAMAGYIRLQQVKSEQIQPERMIPVSDTMTISINKNGRRKQNGFTLAEAMIAMVVLGMAAAGVLLPFSSGAAVQVEGMRRTLAANLASHLIEEIINTPFEDIVSSYDGYSEEQGQIKDAGDEIFSDSNYANFSRSVTCAEVNVPQESGTLAPEFILVTVQVSYSGRPIATINRLISE
jgi:prepilin-type N-terminal cleavage/methylation domain-containing protein